MSIFFKARGSSSFGLLLIRLVIGFTFLIAGTIKVLNLEAFVNHVKSFEIFSQNAAFILGFILPFMEVFFGALYIIGFFTPLTSLVLTVLTISFLTAGEGLFTAPEPFTLPVGVYYFIILSCTLATLFGGAGVVSFDALFDKKRKIAEVQKQEPIIPELVKPPEAIKDVSYTDLEKEKPKADEIQ
ncbi:MAG: DoxX family protein [Ignavibacteria bacterium]